MNRLVLYKLIYTLAALVLVGLTAACQQSSPPVVATAEPMVVATEPPAAAVAEQQTAVTIEPEATDYCLNCHTNSARLQSSLEALGATAGADGAGALAILYGIGSDAETARSRTEQLLVDARRFPQTVHGQIECIECHGGVQSADAAIAHTDLVARPSEHYEATCGECHENVTATYANSLHYTAAGLHTSLQTRAHSSDLANLQSIFDATCVGCAATCGDCHVGQSISAGGGLVEGHLFRAEPNMALQCTACHGVTVAGEYLGAHGDVADVHFSQGNMTCTDCHSSHEMHGQLDNCQACHAGPMPAQSAPADHRFSGSQSPSCESCHVPAATASDGNVWHAQHGSDLSCQTCHAVEYNSCTSCHIDGDGALAFESVPGVMIGQNPLRSFARPYQYVTLRHVPITPDTFDAYGDGLLAYFDQLETWRYATPHTIQLRTPQTQTCFGCHGNEAIFLTADKLAPYELNANADVIVPAIPQEVEDEVAP